MSDWSELEAEAVAITRATAQKFLGGNVTFVDDDIKLLGVLASRAVLAGLHADIKCERTRKNLERAAAEHREGNERALGFVIVKQIAPEPPEAESQ